MTVVEVKYDSDFDYEEDCNSDLEDLLNSGKEVKIIYFDSIEQFLQCERELYKLNGSSDESDVVRYIKIRP